jgi:hypothetical protein
VKSSFVVWKSMSWTASRKQKATSLPNSSSIFAEMPAKMGLQCVRY